MKVLETETEAESSKPGARGISALCTNLIGGYYREELYRG
jgi:hypothetical protein